MSNQAQARSAGRIRDCRTVLDKVPAATVTACAARFAEAESVACLGRLPSRMRNAGVVCLSSSPRGAIARGFGAS
jgi:hypothetical protein